MSPLRDGSRSGLPLARSPRRRPGSQAIQAVRDPGLRRDERRESSTKPATASPPGAPHRPERQGRARPEGTLMELPAFRRGYERPLRTRPAKGVGRSGVPLPAHLGNGLQRQAAGVRLRPTRCSPHGRGVTPCPQPKVTFAPPPPPGRSGPPCQSDGMERGIAGRRRGRMDCFGPRFAAVATALFSGQN